MMKIVVTARGRSRIDLKVFLYGVVLVDQPQEVLPR